MSTWVNSDDNFGTKDSNIETYTEHIVRNYTDKKYEIHDQTVIIS